MSIEQNVATAPSEVEGPTILASIGALVDGKRAFAVTYPKGDPLPEGITKNTSITFSIKHWKGATPPECGQMVELSNVTRYVAGWRAASAKPCTPTPVKK